MPDIHVTFTNGYGESRQYQIWDLERDPNVPPEIFSGYLDTDQTTEPLPIHSNDCGASRVAYQRSDGPHQVVDSLSEGDNVRMD